jgi:hypothetical protein
LKSKIEWKDGEVWRQASVDVKYSRNSNLYFQHNGAVYAFRLLKEGSEVVMKNSQGRWVKAGRITRDCIFLGNGLSWSETNELKFKNEQRAEMVTW